MATLYTVEPLLTRVYIRNVCMAGEKVGSSPELALAHSIHTVPLKPSHGMGWREGEILTVRPWLYAPCLLKAVLAVIQINHRTTKISPSPCLPMCLGAITLYSNISMWVETILQSNSRCIRALSREIEIAYLQQHIAAPFVQDAQKGQFASAGAAAGPHGAVPDTANGAGGVF